MSRASIVMVSYHTGPCLWIAIESVLRQPECKELIIVDNGNIARERDRLAQLAVTEPRVRHLFEQGNVGFARGCNLGAAQASGDYLLLLNPDCMLEDDSLAKALSTMDSYPEKTLAGCHLINPDGTEQRGSRRALLTPKNAFAEVAGVEHLVTGERLNQHGEPMPEAAHEVPAISGAFMLTTRAFYTALGGMDEGYFLHVDDMDFCFRVHEAGGKVIVLPQVKVLHFRSTSEVGSNVVEKHKTRGFIRYFNKHFSKQYSAPVRSLMALAIWARYGVKYVINSVDAVFEPPLPGKQEIARLALLYRLARFAPQTSALEGRTILVMGATGQVGLCLIGKALAQGAKVIAVYRNTVIPFTHPNLEWVQCNIADPQHHLEQIKADTLFYCAALWLLPVVMPALAETGISRIIAFSSTSVFAKTGSTNAQEKDIAARLEQGETDVLAMDEAGVMQVTILRPTMVYGVGLDSNVARMADAIRRFGRLPIYKPASGLRHPVQAEDLADIVLALLDNPVSYGKAYTLGGPTQITYRQMMEAIFAYLGKPPRFVAIPLLPQLLNFLGTIYSFTSLNGDMALRMNRDQVFDMQPAIDDFGYAPNDFLVGEVIL